MPLYIPHMQVERKKLSRRWLASASRSQVSWKASSVRVAARLGIRISPKAPAESLTQTPWQVQEESALAVTAAMIALLMLLARVWLMAPQVACSVELS